jgi:hypothetical protein
MRRWTSVLAVSLGLAMCSTARAQRVPMHVAIEHGWDTRIHVLAPIPADSKIGREFPNRKMVVGFAFDQYWLAIPIWNRRGSFVICPEVDESEKPDEYWILNEQGLEEISTAVGVPADRLVKPLLYYIPWGWLLVAAIAAFVKLTSGPGPHKRFRRLWSQPTYRAATARFLGVEESRLPEEFDTLVLESFPAEPEARFEEVVAWLVDQGIGRRRAVRDLEFLSMYLVDNGKLIVVPPAEEAGPPEDAGGEEPAP